MDVSVIIVNFNTAKMTAECIESIYQFSKGIEFEIIIVDNNSQDNSVDYIHQNYPKVNVIALDENKGFGKANNIGANSARGKYLFFLNSDTLLKDNALKTFFSFSEKYSTRLNIGIIGGILLNTQGTQCESFDKFPNATTEFLKLMANHQTSINYVKNKFANNATEKYFKVDYVCGADLFMSKELFARIGGFDPLFFMYYEESDMQKRICDLSKNNYILKDVHILHYGGGSDKKQLSLRKRTIVSSSCLKYMRKHHCAFYYYIFKSMFITLEVCKLIVKRKYFNYRSYIHTILKI